MTKFPTPEYKIDDESIYPPSEDTHLLLDALEKEKDEITIIKPSISVEIGCGSGVVTVFLNQLLSKSPSTSSCKLYSICTDLNAKALECSKRTAQMNSIEIHGFDFVHCNILDPLFPRISNSVDILLMNPPYVPTEESPKNENELCFAGGIRGRNLLDKLLPRVAELLSPNGVFYLVALKENSVDELISDETRNKYGLYAIIVLERKCRNEHLYVLKFRKIASENKELSRVHPPLQQQSTVQTINSKITVHVKPVGDAPQLQKEYTRYKVNPAFTVAQLHKELRRRLGIAPADSLYLFVHAAFAPSLDNTIGNLQECFGSDKGILYIQYSLTPAWG